MIKHLTAVAPLPDYGSAGRLRTRSVSHRDGAPIRGRIIVGLAFCRSDPRLSGLEANKVNINFGPDRKGAMWGTYEQPVAGGVQRGNLSGSIDLANPRTDYKTVGHIWGGTIDGIQYESEGHPCDICPDIPLTFQLKRSRRRGWDRFWIPKNSKSA